MPSKWPSVRVRLLHTENNPSLPVHTASFLRNPAFCTLSEQTSPYSRGVCKPIFTWPGSGVKSFFGGVFGRVLAPKPPTEKLLTPEPGQAGIPPDYIHLAYNPVQYWFMKENPGHMIKHGCWMTVFFLHTLDHVTWFLFYLSYCTGLFVRTACSGYNEPDH